MIANVLLMLNVATSRATAANTTRNVRRKPRKSSSIWSLASSTSSEPLITSTSADMPAATRSTISSSLVPLSARTSSDVTSPGRPVMCSSAPASENAVNVVGPSPSSPPNVAIPTIVTSTGSGVATIVVSPTARSPSSAAPRLITTSSVASGARPSTSS